MDVLWHRRDLRPDDNAAAAAADGPVIPVFVLDPAVLEHANAARVAFLLESLADLRGAYRDRGGDLLVRRGDPAEALVAAAEANGADAVVWNDDYSGLSRARDARVRTTLREAGLETALDHDVLLHPPGSVRTNAGTPYQVFSPFYDSWDALEHPEPHGPTAVTGADDRPVPTAADLGFDDAPAADLSRGHRAAAARLEAFCDGPIYAYDEARDYPARQGTSRLSADLKFGTVGVRTVWAATERAREAAADAAATAGVEEFQRQLAWREFYAEKLAFGPELIAENHREFDVPIDWRDDPDELARWRAGETGYPFVDAGMRQLEAEAWLPNRVRMVVASFLTKDLLADWRHGYAWFRERLVDHDPANDAGGWQWAASTGFDAQPYFRVFNPTTQGERYDPEARYIARHVPELAAVPAAAIHRWPELEADRRAELAPDYPAPMVDHAQRREAAIAAFERARGD